MLLLSHARHDVCRRGGDEAGTYLVPVQFVYRYGTVPVHWNKNDRGVCAHKTLATRKDPTDPHPPGPRPRTDSNDSLTTPSLFGPAT